MAGTNPDPAEALPVVEILRQAFTEAVKPVADSVEKLSHTILEYQSSPVFEVVTFALAPGLTPVVLLGYDRGRVRTLLRATTADVYIGSRSQLASGNGYQLPTTAGDEIKTTGEISVIYNPAGAPDPLARVTAWIERRT